MTDRRSFFPLQPNHLPSDEQIEGDIRRLFDVVEEDDPVQLNVCITIAQDIRNTALFISEQISERTKRKLRATMEVIEEEQREQLENALGYINRLTQAFTALFHFLAEDGPGNLISKIGTQVLRSEKLVQAIAIASTITLEASEILPEIEITADFNDRLRNLTREYREVMILLDIVARARAAEEADASIHRHASPAEFLDELEIIPRDTGPLDRAFIDQFLDPEDISELRHRKIHNNNNRTRLLNLATLPENAQDPNQNFEAIANELVIFILLIRLERTLNRIETESEVKHMIPASLLQTCKLTFDCIRTSLGGRYQFIFEPIEEGDLTAEEDRDLVEAGLHIRKEGEPQARWGDQNHSERGSTFGQQLEYYLNATRNFLVIIRRTERLRKMINLCLGAELLPNHD
jgi:hypothetical protein